MWGQAYTDFDGEKYTRIIPTRVGTSLLLSCFAPSDWDHPHACGDKLIPILTAKNIQGSSPRVWGQACCYRVLHRLTGIIPTRVGTRRIHVWRWYNVWDHPHACGDKLCCLSESKQSLGSSPRVWGQDFLKRLPTR